MARRIPTEQIHNLQQIEAVVAGPDGANRLFTFTGQLDIPFTANEPQGNVVSVAQRETFTVLLGPVLTRQEFIRAIGAAWPTKVNITTPGVNVSASGNSSVEWGIAEVDADMDDESRQVELRVEVFAIVSRTSVNIQGLGFQVTILAAVAG